MSSGPPAARITEALLMGVAEALRPDVRKVAAADAAAAGADRHWGSRGGERGAVGRLAGALVRAASRSKDTYLGERYRRLARRRGDRKAIIAVAHEILDATWIILSTGEVYREQGPTIVSDRDADYDRRRAIRQLARLGRTVTLGPLPEAA